MTNPTDHFQAELAELYQRGAELCRRDDEKQVRSGQHIRRCANLERLCAGFPHPVRALDMGCGTGRYFHCLTNTEMIVGSDQSRAMLLQAKNPVNPNAKARANVVLIPNDLYEMAFAAGAFDIIYSFGVFGHGAALTPELCQRLYTWLAPGGRLYFDAVDRGGAGRGTKWTRKFLRVFFPFSRRRKVQRWFDAIPVVAHSREQIGSFLGAAGFTDVVIEGHDCRELFFRGSVLECSAMKSRDAGGTRVVLSPWLSWPEKMKL